MAAIPGRRARPAMQHKRTPNGPVGPAPNAAPDESANVNGSDSGKETFGFVGKRMWTAAFVAMTYILAFGRTGDGVPFLEAGINSVSDGLSLPTTGRDRMPPRIGVPAYRKAKLVQRGRSKVVERVGLEATSRRSGGRNSGSTVGLHARRDTTQAQTAKRHRTVPEQDPKTGRFKKAD